MNRGPHSYQECALPPELRGPVECHKLDIDFSNFQSGQGRIRTPEGVCQLIYSQSPLATWVPALVCPNKIDLLSAPQMRDKGSLAALGLASQPLSQSDEVSRQGPDGDQPTGGQADGVVEVKGPDDAHGVHDPTSDHDGDQRPYEPEQLAHLFLLSSYWHATRLAQRNLSRRRDLNPRPSVYKTLALPLSYAGTRGLHSHVLGVLRIPRDKTAAPPLSYIGFNLIIIPTNLSGVKFNPTARWCLLAHPLG